ncbi:alpha/beta hydrolase [Methanocalculus taiwanensis]|uniref:Alpha/beta hydrolase n=1 Tax=Methanocalculus taiwanensis TaxID=106207 RepID=A0ABD4TIH8_9EURY|nr:alpha/beta hydrolase [Methanocalculus taiwanensis]MCQ1538744.1 alpha/beta hydrolase [Methanocalculus taiwanensis]
MILTPDDRLVLIRGQSSFLICARAGRKFPLMIETVDSEYVQGIYPDDIIAVSAPEGGELIPACYLLDLVRKYNQPLLVLPRGHPGSGRLRYVVSAGSKILLSCEIMRGTHPKQHLICSSAELAGLEISGENGSILIKNLPDAVKWEYLPYIPPETEQQL